MSKDLPGEIKKAPNPAGTGGPVIAEEQYAFWLKEMSPFLSQGCSLNYAMEKCNITTHKDAIYEKYRSDKDFSEKIDTIRARAGELANLIVTSKLEYLHKRMVETSGAYNMTDDEEMVVKLVAEKHRTAQPFFVNRVEQADASKQKEKDFGKVIDAPSIEYVTPTDPAPDEVPGPTNNETKPTEQPQPTANTVPTDPAPTPGVAETG